MGNINVQDSATTIVNTDVNLTLHKSADPVTGSDVSLGQEIDYTAGHPLPDAAGRSITGTTFLSASTEIAPARSILDYLPVFLKAMQTYVASGFTDVASAAIIQAAGYPADIKQASATHPSLWFEYYANQSSFYSDLTAFAYALLLDPTASSSVTAAGCTPNAVKPAGLPGTCAATGCNTLKQT